MQMNRSTYHCLTIQGKEHTVGAVFSFSHTHSTINPIFIDIYCSDEGDTSSTSTDDEGKDRLSDLEGPCCQPLKVPPCSPVHEEKPKKKVFV